MITGKELKKNFEWLKAQDGGCCWHKIGYKNDYIIAIVTGWTCEGLDELVIATKVAYQSKNSIMQCDYDWDWMMPMIDAEFGEVYDSELVLSEDSDFEEVAEYINKDAKYILEHFEEGELK